MNHDDIVDVKIDNLANNKHVFCDEAGELSEKCCSRNGICSHEVLRNGNPDSDAKMVRKVCYISLLDLKVVMMNLKLVGCLLVLRNMCLQFYAE